MTTEKTRAALAAFGDLLDALEASAGWDAGPLRVRIDEAEGELAGFETGGDMVINLET